MAALAVAIGNSWVGNQDGGFGAVSVVLAETVKAWVWHCCSTLQTYCHSALQPPNVSFYPRLAVPLNERHSVEAVLSRNLPDVRLDSAGLASFVHIRLAVCFQRSHAALAGFLPGDVDRQHQVRGPVALVIAASLQAL